jgi:secondary thiamine-phosphate synthase enzyme
MKKIKIASGSGNELINITSDIQKAVQELDSEDRVITVFCPHTTAGVTINESADPDVQRDMINRLSQISPADPHYQHAEGNSDAHIKSSLIGSSVQVIVGNGELQLGTWQAIYFCEFDGPRNREVWIK